MMAKATINIDEAINFAEAVLASDPKKGFKVEHVHKYFSGKGNKNPLLDEELEHRIVYSAPGQALSLEVKDLYRDSARAGLYPQHNSAGEFPDMLEIIPSLQLNNFVGLSTPELLETSGFVKTNATLTKKKVSQIQAQFANLSPICFEEMMCINLNDTQRDFEVYANYVDDEIIVAYLNPKLQITQFFQSYKLDGLGEIYDVKHVVCEAGLPIVINQTIKDCYGNLRNIAHVGVTGSKKNNYFNSLERFDDNSFIWTSSDYKYGRNLTGSAVLFDDGRIELIDGSDHTMSEVSARNLGAEAINPKTLKWKGKFSHDGCIAEEFDKYVVRREYKAKVRTQVNQIIDGACIPGFDPIFKVNI